MNAEELIQRRKDRAIAIILRMKESECDTFLPAAVRVKLRKIILDQLNDLADVMFDVIKSLDAGDVVLNEIYLQKILEMHEVMTGGNRPAHSSS